MDGVLRNTTYPRKVDLRELDFMSGGLGITISRQDRVRSYVGAVASLGIYTTLILACIYFIGQFLDDDQPNTQFSTFFDNRARNFKVSSMGTSFFFLIGNPAAKIGTFDGTDTYDPSKDSPEPASVDATTSSHPSFTKQEDIPREGLSADQNGHRILQKSSATSYLKQSELGLYFNATLSYEILEFSFVGQQDVRKVTAVKLRLVPCNTTAWFTDQASQTNLKKNIFLYELVSKYGICIGADSNTQIYGDPLSSKSSRIRLQLEYCDSSSLPGCLDSSLSDIRDAQGIDLVVGTYAPSVNVANKANPWNFDLTTLRRASITPLTNIIFTVPMKDVIVSTDEGRIIEDFKNQSRAIPLEISAQYVAAFIFGKSMVDFTNAPKADDSSYFSVMYGGKELTYLDFRLISSRYVEIHKRKYMSILELFGNIGGSVEFLIVIFMCIFHWYENLHTQSKVRSEVLKSLGLTEKVLSNSTSAKKCMPWIKNSGPPTGQGNHPELHKLAKEALDQMSESAINLEDMVVRESQLELLLPSLVPGHVLKLLPVVSMMEKMVQVDEEVKQQQLKSQIENTKKEKYQSPTVQTNSIHTSRVTSRERRLPWSKLWKS